jgi:hypothetical protein
MAVIRMPAIILVCVAIVFLDDELYVLHDAVVNACRHCDFFPSVIASDSEAICCWDIALQKIAAPYGLAMGIIHEKSC